MDVDGQVRLTSRASIKIGCCDICPRRPGGCVFVGEKWVHGYNSVAGIAAFRSEYYRVVPIFAAGTWTKKKAE
jgi:hypothetical protein